MIGRCIAGDFTRFHVRYRQGMHLRRSAEPSGANQDLTGARRQGPKNDTS